MTRPQLKTLVEWLATWFGLGHMPFVPGTFGTLGAIPVVYAFALLGPLPYMIATIVFIVFAVMVSQLYESFHARLPHPPRCLTAFERDALMHAAASAASTSGAAAPSFRLRPGLMAEILRFYDQLRRQSQLVNRFEELIEEALCQEVTSDRGAERMLQQTRFLAATFRDYERRAAETGACDEHALRQMLMTVPAVDPVRHVVVTVPDWIADPGGLFVADFDLLARVAGLEAIDIICTEAVLASGFHERIHNWWPGLEEVEAADVQRPRVKPTLLTPPDAHPDQPWFTSRDREEELAAIARRIRSEGMSPDRVAIVYKRSLPYLYLAPDTLGAAGIAWQSFDGLPLAAEPAAAVVDVVLDCVATNFSRDAIVALLRSPHFRFPHEGQEISRGSISALNRELSDARYLGDLAHLERLHAAGVSDEAQPALEAAVSAGRELASLVEPASASQQIRRVLGFVTGHASTMADHDPFGSRERRARAAVADLLASLAAAHEAYHDPQWTIEELATVVRRWIAEETFVPESAGNGVQLVDDQAVRYGDFDEMALVGLVENEWPERPRRNIFYSVSLLRALGWPSEKDRRAAEEARFLDLVGSASCHVMLSTFTLDDEAIVTRSVQLDDLPRARLTTVALEPHIDPLSPESTGHASQDWLEMRMGRSSAEQSAFHGNIGVQPRRAWSVSALETYLQCPFKFFARHVLHLDEEPGDEEIMDPRRQGQFIHEVFEEFFATWQAAGRQAITPVNLDEARTLFAEVVERALERLPEAEGGLERTRLLGSPAAAGLGEAVLRMEAERPIGVMERLLEYPLKADFTIATAHGTRVVALRGKVDRLDLLEDGTFRLIDYKLGWPPDKTRALQLPVYGVCAEQRLDGYRGRQWTLGEAAYVAFKGPKRIVPLFLTASARDEVLSKAQQRLAETIDAIERGEFPPSPDDVFRCETCAFAAVCRKDYVGDI